jgi:hypothetical protein
MAKFFPELSDTHIAFIREQHLFFVGSAPADGRVNVSPKGLESFRVLSPRDVGYLDCTGSGNETAAHLAENGRVTFMFCAFAGAPLILRIYGRGRIVHPRDAAWAELRAHFGAPMAGERQLVLATVESVQTSCGFGVPLFSHEGPRTTLTDYWAKKGPNGVAAYWAERNTRSIDGLPTHLLS